MRKVIALLLLISFLLEGCSYSNVNISGLDNFGTADCSYELSRDLFPDETFLSSFKYSNGNYELQSNDGLSNSQSIAFAFLTYSPTVYENAKQYCLDHLDFCDDHQFTYADFKFRERLSHFTRDASGDLVVGCCFPKWFNMFAYSDTTYTLVFIGYYNSDAKVNEIAQSDFASFVERFYAKYYDFGDVS